MGTMLQSARSTRPASAARASRTGTRDVRGNNDLLTLTQPDAVRDIHLAYFQRRRRYRLDQHLLVDRDRAGRLRHGERWSPSSTATAREARARGCGAWLQKEDGRPRFVAGAIGPTNRTASISPDVNNPGFRAVTLRRLEARLMPSRRGPARRRRRYSAGRDDLRHAQRQGRALRHRRAGRGARREIAGDDLRHHHRSARAACCPARRRKRSGIRSGTPRRCRSGSIARSAPRKCARISPRSARVADTLVCAYPNAGLPNEFGRYDESPGAHGRAAVGEFARVRPGQYRRRLLRHDARAYARHRAGGRRQDAAQDSRDRAACCGCPASSRSRSRRKSPSSMSASAPTSPARPSSAS